MRQCGKTTKSLNNNTNPKLQRITKKVINPFVKIMHKSNSQVSKTNDSLKPLANNYPVVLENVPHVTIKSVPDRSPVVLITSFLRKKIEHTPSSQKQNRLPSSEGRHRSSGRTVYYQNGQTIQSHIYRSLCW